ncbi:hypothetical protein LGN07_15470 [Burkholderia cepacia]|uniref:hypothetical protein n=1 Tax=Burkholderia cepacia TaxID=292 RepID=UPI0012D8F77A|nr:hypothetical protein [Burkholderia cepacia]MCA8120118.1 hypothetical protein [Burkholderia cepacia]
MRYSYLRSLFQLTSELIERHSPSRQVQPRTVPAYICWGGREQSAFAIQASLMRERWLSAGNQARLQQHPDHDHYTILSSFDSADGALTRAALALLDAKQP